MRNLCCLLSSHPYQVLVSYGYDWIEAPEWYKQAWSKSKYRLAGDWLLKRNKVQIMLAPFYDF